MAPQDPAPASWPRRLPGLVSLAATLGVAGLLAWHSLTDLDIWVHLRSGTDLLAGGGFPRSNTYSFLHPDHPWLNHEWLFQVFAVAFGPSGDGSVLGWNLWRTVLVVALAVVLGVGTFGRRWSGRSAGAGLTVRATLLLAGLTLLWPRFNLRPELVSYLLFVLLVRWVDAHFLRPAPAGAWRDKANWRLFALVLLWAQCHGFAVLAPAVVVLGVLLRPFDRRGTGRPDAQAAVWIAPLFLSVAALALTPNLWHGLLFPVRAVGQFQGDGADLQGTISELVPLLQTPNALGHTLLAFKISLGWGLVFALLAGRALSPMRLVLFGLSALAAVANQRNVALYGLSFVLLHGGLEGSWPTPAWRRRLRLENLAGHMNMRMEVAIAVLVAALCGWWAQGIVSNDFYLAEGVGRRFGGGRTPAIYPSAAAAALHDGRGDRTVANLDAAAFLLGTTNARLFIDGRTEAYPAAAWQEYRQLRRAGPPALSLLARQKASAIVLALQGGAFTPLARDLVASPAWRPVAADAAGVLFAPAATAVGSDPTNLLTARAEEILAGPEGDPTRRADRALAAAGLFDLAGNTVAARRALIGGLEARPDHPQLNHNLGNRLLADGEFAAARERFAAALAVNRRLAGSALNLGVCALRLGRRTEAIGAFRRSLAIDSDQVGAWVNLAVALDQEGDRKAAVAALQKAAALRPGDARLQSRLREWRQER